MAGGGRRCGWRRDDVSGVWAPRHVRGISMGRQAWRDGKSGGGGSDVVIITITITIITTPCVSRRALCSLFMSFFLLCDAVRSQREEKLDNRTQ